MLALYKSTLFYLSRWSSLQLAMFSCFVVLKKSKLVNLKPENLRLENLKQGKLKHLPLITQIVTFQMTFTYYDSGQRFLYLYLKVAEVSGFYLMCTK